MARPREAPKQYAPVRYNTQTIMGTDVFVGISPRQLNDLAVAAYRKLRPGLFSGNGTVHGDSGQVALHWEVAQAPFFQLDATFDSAEAKHALLARMPETPGAEHAAAIENLIGGLQTFTILLPEILITFPSLPAEPLLVLTARIQANAAFRNHRIVFGVVSVSVSTFGTPLQQAVATQVIQPAVQQLANQLLGGLSIPLPDVPGAILSPFNVGIVKGSLVAVATTNGPLPDLPTNGFPGLGAPFVVALTKQALQVAANLVLTANNATITGGDSSGGSGLSVHYNYSVQAGNPQVEFVSGATVPILFDLTGSAGAGAEVVYVPIGIGVNLGTDRPIELYLRVEAAGSTISLVYDSLSWFNVQVSLSGAVGSLLGWMTDWLLSAIGNSLKPKLTNYLQGVNFGSLTLPNGTRMIGNVPVTVTTSLNQPLTMGTAGMLVISGKIQIS